MSLLSLADFVEKFDGAPFDLDEYAEGAAKINDPSATATDLREAAQQYLEAVHHFIVTLEEAGVNLG